MVARLFLVYKNIFCRKIKIQISKKKKGKKVTIVSHTKAATIHTHTHTHTHTRYRLCTHGLAVCTVSLSALSRSHTLQQSPGRESTSTPSFLRAT